MKVATAENKKTFVILNVPLSPVYVHKYVPPYRIWQITWHTGICVYSLTM